MLARNAMTAAAVLLAAGTGWTQWTVTEEAKLTATDPESGDRFGESVAISGDTIIVGVPQDDNASGTAYVFVQNGTSWVMQATLHASDSIPKQYFGQSVALSGDTVIIGAPGSNGGVQWMLEGSAYVFVRNGTSWTEEAKLIASDGEIHNDFGISVTIEGDTAIVGAFHDDYSFYTDAGSAYVFVRDGTTWTEQQRLIPITSAESFGEFGVSVSLSGESVLIGAREFNYSGAAYVFVRSGSTWSLQQWFSAIDTLPGDSFGERVAVSGDTALIGAPFDNTISGGPDAGSAYVFVREGSTWVQQQKLTAVPPVSNDFFGTCVAVEGDLATVGDPGFDSGGVPNSGAVFLFKRNGTSWEQPLPISASDKESHDRFGFSVAMSGNGVVVGAPYDSLGGGVAEIPGSAYAFGLASPAAIYCTAGVSASGCQASIGHLGEASASNASGFDLLTSEVEGSKDGLFYFGTHGRQANPWGNGTSYQCVVPPLVRLPIMTGIGTVGLCDGSFALDLNALWCPTCPKATKNPGAGAVVQAQLWYRDPFSTSNQTTSLSDAVEFVMGP